MQNRLSIGKTFEFSIGKTKFGCYGYIEGQPTFLGIYISKHQERELSQFVFAFLSGALPDSIKDQLSLCEKDKITKLELKNHLLTILKEYHINTEEDSDGLDDLEQTNIYLEDKPQEIKDFSIYTKVLKDLIKNSLESVNSQISDVYTYIGSFTNSDIIYKNMELLNSYINEINNVDSILKIKEEEIFKEVQSKIEDYGIRRRYTKKELSALLDRLPKGENMKPFFYNRDEKYDSISSEFLNNLIKINCKGIVCSNMADEITFRLDSPIINMPSDFFVDGSVEYSGSTECLGGIPYVLGDVNISVYNGYLLKSLQDAPKYIKGKLDLNISNDAEKTLKFDFKNGIKWVSGNFEVCNSSSSSTLDLEFSDPRLNIPEVVLGKVDIRQNWGPETTQFKYEEKKHFPTTFFKV